MIKLIVLLISLFAAFSLNAQYAITSGGGSSDGNGGSVSYSVGQLFYSNNEGTNGTLVEGVLQSYEISITTGKKEINITLEVIAYPNPTTDFLILKVVNSTNKNLMCRLYNLQGKLLEHHKIVDDQYMINMRNLMISTYYLKVFDINEKVVKTFRIVKN